MPKKRIKPGPRFILPDSYFRCESAERYLTKTADFHFADDEGGYMLPEDLYFAQFIESDMQVDGFFCKECVEVMGRKVTWRQSLLEAMEESSRRAV